MKPRNRKRSLKKAAKNPITQTVSVATVVASLGVPLGINVADLYAASQTTPVRNESVQHKGAISSDLESLSASQLKLSEQIKLTNASQTKFQTLLIEGTKQGKFKGESKWGKSMAQYKELQATELKLANQIGELQADDLELSNKLNLLKANFLKGQATFLKSGQANQYDDWQANELKLSNQIKQLSTNEHKISEQLKQLQPPASE